MSTGRVNVGVIFGTRDYGRDEARIYCLKVIARIMARAVTRSYSGGLGAMLPVESRGKAPGQGVKGRSPLKLKAT